MRGVMIGFPVFASHYGEDRLSVEESGAVSFVEQTLRTTRNVSGGFWMDELTGNMSRQIEHHLFPTCPPSNLAKVAPRVRAFAAKHGLPYKEYTLFGCMRRNIDNLVFPSAGYDDD